MTALASHDRGRRAATRTAVLLLAGLWLLLGPSPAVAQITADAPAKTEAGSRVALVIGNDAYRALPKLSNAANDARAINRALKDVGFETILRVNASRREMYQAIDAFAGKIATGAVGLFYYAGHGVQSNGTNYLVPVDAEIATETDLEADGINIQRVLRAMDTARNPLNIVILDACRDNPLPKSRSLTRGLYIIEAPRGTFIAYAAAPGQVAQDGDAGGNGVFTSELVKAIEVPGLKLEDVFKRVVAGVSARTGGKQVPWTEASLQGDFYFQLPRPAAAAAPAPGTPEMMLWSSVKDSRDPAQIQAYLDQFPQGTFAGLAKVMIGELKRGQMAALAAKAEAPAETAPTEAAPAESAPAAPAPAAAAPQSAPGKRVPQTAALPPTAAVPLPLPVVKPAPPAAAELSVTATPEAAARRGPTSAKEIETLAKGGDPRAQYDLATLYVRGNELPRDYTQAARWFRESALQGIAGAQYNLGVLYQQGLGIEKNATEAMRWYLSAARQGYPPAEYNVGTAYAKGKGVDHNDKEARKWFGQAAEQGLAVAALNLGVLFEDGRGGPADAAEAYKWYKIAERGGATAAEKYLTALSAKMTPEAIAEGTRRYEAAASSIPARPSYEPDRHLPD